MGEAYLVQNFAAAVVPYVSDGLQLYLDAADSSSYPGSGDTWFDLSGNNRNATRVNSVTYVNSGPKYFDFNGSTHYFVLDPASVQGGGQVSLEFWNQALTNKTSSLIFGSEVNTTNQTLNIHSPWSEGTTYWDFNDRINKGGTPLNSWNHWVFTKNTTSGIMEIYLNGVLWHSGTGKTTIVPTLGVIHLGRIPHLNLGTYAHRGFISLVRSYNRQLSQAEVQQNFNLDKARFGL